ncbi:Rieske 2Fe-2S domain-containing protein [Hymenobacter busanensis]|uniref:Rieske 2Fe-2S domain-containing protein n=2 Tax=Hymenobacter busanensis TaxID=2607656 RepID=A0A7L5A3J1_9BACT|nr:Rieske 2Fe-2S domain-containing protein [Hymenobacter busanensis]QHJ09695.1 Rieske 2Fe-2S domain-containing protein [Hymenobacter busanensis]
MFSHAPLHPLRQLLVACVLLIGLTACGSSSSNPQPQIPTALVNENINLTNQQYSALRLDGGYVYLSSGVRGIIVLRRNSQQYLAFERNCPYLPGEACATVGVHSSGLYFEDTCCGSKFDLEGQVTAGPAQRQLRQYITALSGNFLSITN